MAGDAILRGSAGIQKLQLAPHWRLAVVQGDGNERRAKGRSEEKRQKTLVALLAQAARAFTSICRARWDA